MPEDIVVVVESCEKGDEWSSRHKFVVSKPGYVAASRPGWHFELPSHDKVDIWVNLGWYCTHDSIKAIYLRMTLILLVPPFPLIPRSFSNHHFVWMSTNSSLESSLGLEKLLVIGLPPR
jgi:hypothetical protein